MCRPVDTCGAEAALVRRPAELRAGARSRAWARRAAGSPVVAHGRRHKRGARREWRREAAGRAAAGRARDARRGCGTRPAARPTRQWWLGAAARNARTAAMRRPEECSRWPVRGCALKVAGPCVGAREGARGDARLGIAVRQWIAHCSCLGKAGRRSGRGAVACDIGMKRWRASPEREKKATAFARRHAAWLASRLEAVAAAVG
ncbi:hypothetical protein PVAP13_J683605 [Panicum virgatum]|nr:hypothetical protein PVAP13_J683605 [Panicum virgatum]